MGRERHGPATTNRSPGREATGGRKVLTFPIMQPALPRLTRGGDARRRLACRRPAIVAIAVLLVTLVTFGIAPARAFAQADSTADTARALERVRITVTRRDEAAVRAPWAVDVQTRREIAGAQATLGIDEALNSVPGVVVSNRYNWSVDQRVSIRGAGSRANFGIRGIKVLVDGVPQSLPDGQNQLTNLDLAAVSRVEVLRGSASSLYGNGSGGVIAFETDRSAPDRLGVTARVLGGSFGTSKVGARVTGRTDRATASATFSRTRLDGFRQYDTAEVRQALVALDYALGPERTLELRAGHADSPVARNPGALTPTEYARNRDSASAINIARGANKWLSQSQYSARYRQGGERAEWSLVGYVHRRFIDNPLATPPPGTTGAAIGTYSTLNRWVTGARADGGWSPSGWPGAARLTAGVDVQRSFDIRRNWRATGGRRTAATDTLVLDQGESVIAVGPFVSMQFVPTERLTASVGARHDWLTFGVTDNFLRDRVDNSARRGMAASSGHAGASWLFGRALIAYANVATAFETPTTTELSARPDGTGGFNPDLDPQRVMTVEGGARGDVGARLRYTVTLFQSTYRDALIQYLETTGRAYFRNAGETRNRGVEVGATARLASWLDANVAWTESRYRFVRYRVPVRTVTDTLDGKRVAGVPDRFVRAGLRLRAGAFTADVDRTTSGDLFADDKNTVRVAGWGRGVVNVRTAWTGRMLGTTVQPFLGVNNALNTDYIGSVTLNGANARVLEPAPLRHFYLGVETGWAVVR